MKHTNRENWLEAAVKLIGFHFTKMGFTIPEVKVSTGFPSSGGLGKTKRILGQCWAHSASSDGKCQIFISPTIENIVDDPAVLPVLVHELCHAVAGLDAKHGPEFKRVAVGVGLAGKMTSTVPGEELKPTIGKWMLELDEYPHAKLDPKQSPVKKQTTRMVKCTCQLEECGFTVRTTRKWLDDVGSPHCPRHGQMKHDYIAGSDDGDGDDEGGEE